MSQNSHTLVQTDTLYIHLICCPQYTIEMKKLLFVLTYLFSQSGMAYDKLSLRADFDQILNSAGLDRSTIEFEIKTGQTNSVSVNCQKKAKIKLIVTATESEAVSTLYYGLQKLGFLFPHPRWQISPKKEELFKVCGKSFEWKPRFVERGFHLHTLHPSEWTHGFLMDQPQIAEETIRWNARNGQNRLQIVLLEQEMSEIARQLKPLVKLSNQLGIQFGIDVSFESFQQNMARLVSPNSKLRLAWLTLIQANDTKLKDVEKSLKDYINSMPFDFMTIELGTSEYTPSNYENTIRKINVANKILRDSGKSLFIKIHTSVNQIHPEFGNFNFIPSRSDPTVGVLPHTVIFYGLTDERAPTYSRTDFKDMLQFTAEEVKKRPVWYFPETSYYIAMDIDVPIFLTDYLLTRAIDMRVIEDLGVTGHLNFTTGHELGYWFFDWNLALLNNSEYRNLDFPAAKLLGEDLKLWESIIQFQHKYFKKEHVIQELSSSNLLDELTFMNEQTVERKIFAKLKDDRQFLIERIKLLEAAIAEEPDSAKVKLKEIRLMLEVTSKRLRHALLLRKAMLARLDQSDEFSDFLSQAQSLRKLAQVSMNKFMIEFNRYPEALIFAEHENLTSYPYGYGFTAGNLHYWQREEEMIRQDKYWPWFMQIVNPFRIIF